jgi:hypothetical protein
MSILAHITVVQCDRCERLETLTNDVERESFEKLWLRTHSKDFCVLCRETLELADEKVMARVVTQINRKYNPLQLEVTNG